MILDDAIEDHGSGLERGLHLIAQVQATVGLQQRRVVGDREEVLVGLLVVAHEVFGLLDLGAAHAIRGGLGQAAKVLHLLIRDLRHHELSDGELKAHAGVQLREGIFLGEGETTGFHGGHGLGLGHRITGLRNVLGAGRRTGLGIAAGLLLGSKALEVEVGGLDALGLEPLGYGVDHERGPHG